jgi:NAD(P)-dependent dehydrogenase (short-subunit alcohol dehydrogenase family)
MEIVLVTGGSRGIGAATAKYLAKQGYCVCVNYIKNELAAKRVINEIQDAGGNGIAVQADVSNEDDVIRLFNHIDSSLGGITHLVNNAGILLPQMRVTEMSAERINKVLTTNVTSYFLCCREAIKRMTNGGSIVNVSSAAARLGSANEYVDYAASKGAIDTLTIGLSLEVASSNIRVNCVRPGFIDTDMHADGGEPKRIERVKSLIPLQRGGKAKEVAAAIAYLLSDEASYVTGSFIDVAGGR